MTFDRSAASKAKIEPKGPKMRALPRLFLVLACALTVGAVALAATAAGTEQRGRDVQTIDLTTRSAQVADLDLGPTGNGIGDRFVFSDDVFRNGRRVGVLAGECIAQREEPNPRPEGQQPTSVAFNCVTTLQLPEGQITSQGLVTFGATNRFTIAITGGTGAYRAVRGEAISIESEGENEPGQLRLKLIF